MANKSTLDQINNMFAGPTKRNHAGNQQPYVPAGNGDESGEYADSTGVNIHFGQTKDLDTTNKVDKEDDKADKINIDPEKKEQQKPQENIDENDIKAVRKNTTSKLIGKCVNPSRDNDITFKDTVENMNDEGVKILNKYLDDNDKLKIKFGSAGRNAAGRAWGYSQIDTNHDDHTIRHELGHTFDNWYGKELPPNNRNSFESQDYASVRFVDDETGKTMNEMLHQELGVSMYKYVIKGWKMGYEKQGVDKRETKIAAAQKLNDVYNKYADKIFDEMTGIPNSRERYKELRTKYNEINQNLYNDLKDTNEHKELESLRSQLYKAENEYSKEMFSKGATSVYYDRSPEVILARERVRVAREKYEALKQKTFVEKFGSQNYDEYQKISKSQYSVYSKMKGVAGIVGDTFDYLGIGNPSFYTTCGHGESYFKNRREAGYALEIFANMFDCYTSKDNWKKECVKEMFPETTKIFEKIYYKKGVK